MSKAEQKALEAYPIREDFYRRDGIARSKPLDLNVDKRYCYQRGYEQAEKDLQWEVNHAEEAYQNGYVAGLKERLTWQDVKSIVEIADRLCPFTAKDIAEFEHDFRTEEAYYNEVLKRFNDGEKSR